MTRSVLVLNSGSSSVKYAVVDADSGAQAADGIVERIGDGEVPDHAAAMQVVFDELADEMAGLVAVGHRVVHGGPDLYRPTLVDDALIGKLEELSPLAPLHNPPAVLGIEVARKALARAAAHCGVRHRVLPRPATRGGDVCHRSRHRRRGGTSADTGFTARHTSTSASRRPRFSTCRWLD